VDEEEVEIVMEVEDELLLFKLVLVGFRLIVVVEEGGVFVGEVGEFSVLVVVGGVVVVVVVVLVLAVVERTERKELVEVEGIRELGGRRGVRGGEGIGKVNTGLEMPRSIPARSFFDLVSKSRCLFFSNKSVMISLEKVRMSSVFEVTNSSFRFLLRSFCKGKLSFFKVKASSNLIAMEPIISSSRVVVSYTANFNS